MGITYQITSCWQRTPYNLILSICLNICLYFYLFYFQGYEANLHSCSDTSCVGNSGCTGVFHPQNFSKSYLLQRHALKLNITYSVQLVRVHICKVSLTPPPPHSFLCSSSTPSQAKGNGLQLPPHFNGRNALVLDTSLSPCHLALPPRVSHSLPSHSPSPRLPHPLPIPITSPSPRLLHSLSVSSLSPPPSPLFPSPSP